MNDTLRKLSAWLLEEWFKVLPAAVFFTVAFALIAMNKRLMLRCGSGSWGGWHRPRDGEQRCRGRNKILGQRASRPDGRSRGRRSEDSSGADHRWLSGCRGNRPRC
jgi:hypothetical protein